MRIAGRCSGTCPNRKRRRLFRRKGWIIRKVSDMRVGKPRRHRFIQRRSRDSCRVRPRLFVGFESRRRNSPRSMTNLAPLLQNRQHVAVKRRRTRNSVLMRGVLRGTQCRSLIERAWQNQNQRRKKEGAPRSNRI